MDARYPLAAGERVKFCNSYFITLWMIPCYCIVYTNGSQLLLRLKPLWFSEFILEPMSQIVNWGRFSDQKT